MKARELYLTMAAVKSELEKAERRRDESAQTVEILLDRLSELEAQERYEIATRR